MPLQIHMLGALTVTRNGAAVALPASRKVRALLAYLALATRPVSRQRLCELLWENTADPRAELRWHLSKLRAVVGSQRIRQDDDCVRLDLAGSFVDAREVQRAMQSGLASLGSGRVRELLDLFRGEFLEGLDVDCPEFTAWVIAQRRQFRDWRVALFETQAETGDTSLAHVEKWVQVAPFDVRAHGRLFEALVAQGRVRDADEHLAVATRLFAAEKLDCGALRRAWQAARGQHRVLRMTPVRADEQAYDCYLIGRHNLAFMMQDRLEQSLQMFDRAVQLRPDYAPAWAGLATVQAYMNEWFDPGQSKLERAELASRRALEASPKLSEAHAAHALVRAQLKDHQGAARDFESAIRLNPYLFEPYYFFARTSFAAGNLPRAAEMFGLAAQVRPEDFQSPLLQGLALQAIGQEEAAYDAYRVGVHRAELALALHPDNGRALSLAAGALLELGDGDTALDWTRRALELYPDDASVVVNGACVFAKAKEPGKAMDQLERVFALGVGKRDWVMHDPDYRILWPEPRFQSWLSRLK